jgi:hypothetical protein
MRVLWINVLALMIALTAFVSDGPAIQYDYEMISTLQQIPQFQTNALKNDSQKHHEKTVHIAQDFIPIVVIADGIDFVNTFIHYLPIHSLVRQKEYFLLI